MSLPRPSARLVVETVALIAGLGVLGVLALAALARIIVGLGELVHAVVP